jgi:hypothetical protein
VITVLDFFQTYSDALQTIIALLTGICVIVWWRFRRERLPRANLDVHSEHILLQDNTHLVRVTIQVENVGQVLIRVAHLELYVQQLVPTPHVVNNGETVPFDFSPDQSGRELNWPAIASRDEEYGENDRPEFEPDESGPLVFEFRLNELPEVVSLYVHIRNEAKWSLLRWLLRRQPIGWTTSKICRLKHEQSSTT